MEPVMGFEPMTCCLRNSCSTTELHWPVALEVQNSRQDCEGVCMPAWCRSSSRVTCESECQNHFPGSGAVAIQYGFKFFRPPSLRIETRRRFSLRPKVTKDHGHDDDAQHDAGDAVANDIEIGARREALENGEVKGEGDLQAGVGDALTARRDPARDRGNRCREQGERGDSLHVRDDKQ